MSKLIGIAGPARSGKDTLADAFLRVLKSSKIEGKKESFAAQLKLESRQFVMDTIGIDTFTEVTAEKDIIRPFLVTWGTHVRRKLDPDVWIKSVAKTCREDIVTVVADVRYPNELKWVKDKGGYIVYVDRFLGDGTLILPANEEEKFNCPLLKESCDFHLSWGSALEEEWIDNIAGNVLEDIIPTEELKSWILTSH